MRTFVNTANRTLNRSTIKSLHQRQEHHICRSILVAKKNSTSIATNFLRKSITGSYLGQIIPAFNRLQALNQGEGITPSPINSSIHASSIPTRYLSVNVNKEDGFDSWENTPGIGDEGNSKTSSRSLFKAIPINQSILTHIRSLGVGIRPKKKRNKRKQTSNNRNGLLSEANEREFFNNRNKGGNTRSRQPKVVGSEDEIRMPPPPFSSYQTTISRGEDDDFDESGYKIKRLPIKLLGSVGSLKDEMPRSSKGLPEVAIVGRSNVGKSTLLNALLYGNQFDSDVENRKYIRGKTPEGTKMGKGVKAHVSNKPGETKKISFYQLTSELSPARARADETNDDEGQKKRKLSLVLADLPGYGFAYAKEERTQEWNELMKAYLIHRGTSMKRLLFLIDARHGFKKTDLEFLTTLEDSLNDRDLKLSADQAQHLMGIPRSGKARKVLPPIQIVLTKCDLVSQNDLARRVLQMKSELSGVLKREPSALPIMLVSARAGVGFNNVRNNKARGGILELQRELAALVPK